ncbi:hypothetical protein FPQ18DRAFT_391210 [Pyronema domesticum]|uniref:SPIN90/Ldb17 leucine-rich domain-containing protein n=1 Tax=Pyronema omphalodes (strain CBS 100304) TaxID=1076935 RepID=U4LPA4_PYROM|nr:hypothetical protein FPQ18DRAFT_391210 [Pyronema domesticum]CCX33775.1 Similar to hypothetical protein CHGG_00449 [Chaetomium globosum CBS 148.51]; acc. no. XP_001219670 [Pyronema omphalodes CBS 100304]
MNHGMPYVTGPVDPRMQAHLYGGYVQPVINQGIQQYYDAYGNIQYYQQQYYPQQAYAYPQQVYEQQVYEQQVYEQVPQPELEPEIDWREVLRRVVDSKCETVQTFDTHFKAYLREFSKLFTEKKIKEDDLDQCALILQRSPAFSAIQTRPGDEYKKALNEAQIQDHLVERLDKAADDLQLLLMLKVLRVCGKRDEQTTGKVRTMFKAMAVSDVAFKCVTERIMNQPYDSVMRLTCLRLCHEMIRPTIVFKILLTTYVTMDFLNHLLSVIVEYSWDEDESEYGELDPYHNAFRIITSLSEQYLVQGCPLEENPIHKNLQIDYMQPKRSFSKFGEKIFYILNRERDHRSVCQILMLLHSLIGSPIKEDQVLILYRNDLMVLIGILLRYLNDNDEEEGYVRVHEYSIRLLEDLKNNTDLCDSDSVRMDGNGGQNQRDQIYYTLKRIIDHSSGHTLRLAKRCWQVWFEEKKTLLSPYGNPQHATSATSFGHVDKNW